MLLSWRTNYCAGSPMPRSKRKEYSTGFAKIYKLLPSMHYNKTNSIFRVLDPINLIYAEDTFRLDNLYYSFSSDLEGIRYFCEHDKHFKCGKFILLEALPTQALDYQKLLEGSYEDYSAEKDRYAKEHEIVSQLTERSLLNVYVLSLDALENYKQYSVPIADIKDTSKLKALVNWED